MGPPARVGSNSRPLAGPLAPKNLFGSADIVPVVLDQALAPFAPASPPSKLPPSIDHFCPSDPSPKNLPPSHDPASPPAIPPTVTDEFCQKIGAVWVALAPDANLDQAFKDQFVNEPEARLADAKDA